MKRSEQLIIKIMSNLNGEIRRIENFAEIGIIKKDNSKI
jgi:hypothetical protein